MFLAFLANFDWTLSAIISVCALFFGGLIAFIWRDIYERKSKKHKRNKELEEKDKQEKQNNNIRAILQEENKELKSDMKEIKEEISVISEGTQSTLRNQLLTCFYKCSEKKYRTENDTMNFTDMYESYHKLKGNSFIDKDIKPHFYNLPLKRDPHITYKTKNIGRITKVKKSKKEVCSDEK